MNFLENEFIKVSITSKGAELKSVFDKKNTYEFLWQANETIWGRTAPVLFPVIGKCFNNELLIHGKLYPMSQHGFARDMNFEVIEKTESKIIFQLVSSNETLLKFPFHFDLRLSYTLIKNKIVGGYEILNTGNEMLYFSIGAHPGFNLPTKKLTDYFIEFDQTETDERYLLNEGLLNGKTETVFKGTKIELDKILFDKDAIVLKNLQSKKIKLQSKNSTFSIELQCDSFPYFGIWSKK